MALRCLSSYFLRHVYPFILSHQYYTHVRSNIGPLLKLTINWIFYIKQVLYMVAMFLKVPIIQYISGSTNHVNRLCTSMRPINRWHIRGKSECGFKHLLQHYVIEMRHFCAFKVHVLISTAHSFSTPLVSLSPQATQHPLSKIFPISANCIWYTTSVGD